MIEAVVEGVTLNVSPMFPAWLPPLKVSVLLAWSPEPVMSNVLMPSPAVTMVVAANVAFTLSVSPPEASVHCQSARTSGRCR
jgi:hypothetical protein